jgi:hypothetical protein
VATKDFAVPKGGEAPEGDYEAELLALLKREEENAIGYESDQVYQDQIDAFKRYRGENYGNEVAGRSQVHDRTIFETIEWMRPDLVRVFTAGGRAVDIDPWADGTAEQAEDASDYLNHTFFEECEGERMIDAFAFDGLLQKRGVGAVYWEPATLGEPQQAQLDQMQMQQLQQSEAEILGVEPIDEMSAMVTFQMIAKPAKPKVCIIAPEDFRITARATDLERPRYVGHIERMMLSDLREEFAYDPEILEKIEEYAPNDHELADIDERRSERFWDEDEMYKHEPMGHEAATEVRLYREYVFFDKDGDGYAELLEVFRLDGCVLRCDPVDDNPYFSWTPIPIPHKWFGQSIYDILDDVQKIKTTFLRNSIDSSLQALAPRMIANANVQLSDLLNVRPGAIIRTKSAAPVSNDLTPVTMPDTSASALQMLEYVDQMSERRSGISRNAMGMDPDSLNKTATGIKLMQSAGAIRKEQIARNMAIGIEQMFRKLYNVIVRNAKGPQEVHAGKGQFKQYSPSSWPPEAKIRVHVGLGTGDREAQIGQLIQIQAMQREWVANYGLSNPIVTMKELHNTVEDMGRVMGMRGMDQYFKDPSVIEQTPEGKQALQQLMQPKPDPKAQEMQTKMQMEQQKAKQDAQIKQAEMAADVQMEQARLQANREGKEMEIALKREQIAAEMELKREQLIAELALKREMMERELELKRELGITNAAVKINGNASSSVRPGGKAG